VIMVRGFAVLALSLLLAPTSDAAGLPCESLTSFALPDTTIAAAALASPASTDDAADFTCGPARGRTRR